MVADCLSNPLAFDQGREDARDSALHVSGLLPLAERHLRLVDASPTGPLPRDPTDPDLWDWAEVDDYLRPHHHLLRALLELGVSCACYLAANQVGLPTRPPTPTARPDASATGTEIQSEVFTVRPLSTW